MTFISVARFYLQNVLCQSLTTFTGDLVTFVNSHQRQFAQCLTDLWRAEHPLPQTFWGCNDLGASWDSVAMTKMKRDQQISKLQDDHSSEHQLCVIFEAPVWIWVWHWCLRNHSGLQIWMLVLISQLGFKAGDWLNLTYQGIFCFWNYCSFSGLTWK